MERDQRIFFRQQELERCTFVKTILMLLVIVYHSMLFWGGNWFVGTCVYEAPALGVAANWLNSFMIQTFTFTSGYLFAYLKYEKGKYALFGPFVITKAKRLLIPYVVIAAVWVIPFGFAYHNYTGEDVVKKFLLGTSPSQLWFLLMLFSLFVIFWLLSAFFKNHGVWGLFLVLAMYVAGVVGEKFVPNYFMIWRTCLYAPFFYMGLKYRQKDPVFLRKIPAVLWLAAQIGLYALSTYGLNGEGALIKALGLVMSFLTMVFGAVAAFLCLQKLGVLFRSWKTNKVFMLFARCSMPMYLLHQQLLYVSLTYLNGAVDPYTHTLINVVGATLLSLGISWVLMRFRVTRVMIGEK